jgi:hypothetical protein
MWSCDGVCVQQRAESRLLGEQHRDLPDLQLRQRQQLCPCPHSQSLGLNRTVPSALRFLLHKSIQKSTA